ncbi:MAG: signal peptidase I [Chryseolinea sp.]
MKLRLWKKKAAPAPKTVAQEWFNSIVFAVVAATLIRWTTVEAYVVPTPSMENTILVGDYLFVSKFHYGTRTTSTPLQIPLTHQKIWGTNIPSYLDWIELPSYRLPGISEVKREDIVVFNVPPISLNDGVQHPVQLKTNYVKRCIGLPGDVVVIDGQTVRVNGTPLGKPEFMKYSYRITTNDQITDRTLGHLKLSTNDYYYLGKDEAGHALYHMFLTRAQLSELQHAPYVLNVSEQVKTKGRGEGDIFPSISYAPWNGDNYGPLTIPAKGMTFTVSDSTLALYGETIRLYERHHSVELNGAQLVVDGKQLTEYTFGQNYYFMMGDNRHNSLDSRYWGFVPEDHIVGKALFIWMSLDDEAGLFNKVRWNRLFTVLK